MKPSADPLKLDPVAHVNNGCVGCGVCGEVAHAAVLCPSFYKADIVQNPGWFDRLLERVRATLGHATSHPRAIDVTVRDGHVTLRGPVLSREVPRLLMAISNVRGVRSVVNELEAHESSAGIPSLQGSDAIPRAGFRLSRGWSPSAQALAVTGLAATGVWLASRR